MARRFVTDRDQGYRALLRRIAAARAGAVVKVGVQGPKAAASKEPGHGEKTESEHLTLVTVASWMEFGAGPVPERSFIRGWVDENKPEIKAKLKYLGALVIQGKSTIENALEIFGLWAVGQIQARISRGISPALAPATVQHKGSSIPLIDSGQLRASVTYVVEQGLHAVGTA